MSRPPNGCHQGAYEVVNLFVSPADADANPDTSFKMAYAPLLVELCNAIGKHHLVGHGSLVADATTHVDQRRKRFLDYKASGEL
jgi:hypothetical protein